MPNTRQIVNARFSSAVPLCMRASSSITGMFRAKSAAGGGQFGSGLVGFVPGAEVFYKGKTAYGGQNPHHTGKGQYGM